MLVHKGGEAVGVEVGVFEGVFSQAVAEDFLGDFDAGGAVEMSGCGVAEQSGVKGVFYAHSVCGLAEDLLDGARADALCAFGGQQGTGSHGLDIGTEDHTQGFGQRERAAAASLFGDPQQPGPNIDIVDIDHAQGRGSQPQGGQQQEDDPVSQTERTVGLITEIAHKAIHLFLGRRPAQSFRSSDRAAWGRCSRRHGHAGSGNGKIAAGSRHGIFSHGRKAA